VDLKTSRKEIMPQPQPGTMVERLVSDVFDLFPVFDANDPTLLIDAEILDDDRTELLDRALFGCVRQRGQDPVFPDQGIQWAEAVLEEISAPALMGQLNASVQEDGPGVQINFNSEQDGQGRTYFNFALGLTGAT
jgi:hypothetical protein